MSKNASNNPFNVLDPDFNPQEVEAAESQLPHGPGRSQMRARPPSSIPSPFPSAEPAAASADPTDSADEATPTPHAGGLQTTTREPLLTASPTTSEFDQAGFVPVPIAREPEPVEPVTTSRIRKHPGTPSNKTVARERQNVHAAAMRNKKPDPALMQEHLEAVQAKIARLEAENAPQTQIRRGIDGNKSTDEGNGTQVIRDSRGGQIIGTFKPSSHALPPHASSARRPARADPPDEAHATAPAPGLGVPPNREQAAPAGPSNRPPSPHFGKFVRVAPGSYAYARLTAATGEELMRQIEKEKREKARRGPSPARAESSAMGATKRSTFPSFTHDDEREPRIKQEPISPFVIKTAPRRNPFVDSEDEAYESPSEERARRKRAAGKAPAPHKFTFELHGFEEVPAPRAPSAAMDTMSISDSEDDSDQEDLLDLDNAGIAIEHPVPDEDELAATRALDPALANSKIKVTFTGDISNIDGLSRDHYWTNACGDQRRALDKAHGHKMLLRGIGVIGHPEINPRDPAMTALMNKTLRQMFGDNTRALASRLSAPINAPPGEEVAPDIFFVSGLTITELQFLRRFQWGLAGSLQLETHEVDEIPSVHVYVASGAMVSTRRFTRLLQHKWITDPTIIALTERAGALRGIDQAAAMALLILTLRITKRDVVLPHLPGVVTRQFVVNAAANWPADLQRRLRDAASAIVIDTFLHGRAEAWSGWHCIVCHSVSHPTGLCPSRVLEGWAEAADAILRANKEKRNKRKDDDAAEAQNRDGDHKRGGHNGGRGGRGGGANGHGGFGGGRGGFGGGRGGKATA
ncbi:hypothetical protein AURDEDRAFT_119638 [Auricularia subglabra TFB-10046 SS5]|nr:hypothetical protein AURDEDRAFT_119638 [Auricularia subglabra TFB-10046 SS5]